jgi:hypothetical protein
VVVTTTPTPTPTPTENAPTPAEQLQRSITSCDVRLIVFGHDGVAYIKFRGGDQDQVRLGQTTADELFAIAQQQRCPEGKRIVVGIE